MAKGKFRLKRGSASIGGQKLNHADPQNNTVESEENLAALDPQKWERIEDWARGETFEENPRGNQLSDRPQRFQAVGANPGPLTATTSLVKNPDGKTMDDRYGPLDKMEVNELKDIAEAEDIHLPKGAAKKEDYVKALRAKK